MHITSSRLGCASCGNRCPGRCGTRRSNGLGVWESLIPAAASYLMKDGGGGGAPAPGMPSASGGVTVSPAIQTQVSPQISPVFIQQDQPQGSSITAGTSQMLPTSQSATTGQPDPFGGGGGIPGAPAFPSSPRTLPTGFQPGGIPMPEIPGQERNYLPWVIGGGVALLAVAYFLTRKRG